MILLPIVAVAIVTLVVVAGRPGRHATRPEVREVPMSPRAGATAGEVPEWRVALTLGQVEARKLALNPAVLVGAVLSLLALYFREGSAVAGEAAVVQTGLAAFPLAGMTLIAANVNVLRSRREGTDEQLAAAPATARSRTMGHVVSLAAPMALMGALLVVLYIILALGGPAAGDLGIAHLLEMAAAVVLVGCGGACGIVLARWVPTAAVAPLAVVALGFLEGGLGASPQPETNRVRFLGWWTPQPDMVPWDLWPREGGWHLLYLAGLGAFVVAVALLRHGVSRSPMALLAGAVAVVVVSGAVQVQPLNDAEVAHAASWITEPQLHQRCESHRSVTTCHYPGFDFSAEWRSVAHGVRRALPDQAVADVVVRQRPSPRTLDQAPAEIRGRVDPSVLAASFRPPRPGLLVLHPELRWASGQRGTAQLALGTNLAAQVLGLPFEDDAPCLAGGQARAVAALWLAAQAGDAAAATLRTVAAEPASTDLAGMGALERGEHFGEVFGTLWYTPTTDHWTMDVTVPLAFWPSDVDVAAALTNRPDGEVRAILAERWDRIRDPATTTDDMAALFGLPAPLPVERVAATAGVGPDELQSVIAELGGPCS